MLSLTDRYLIQVLRENNYIMSFIAKNDKLSQAFLECLELELLEPPDSWIENNLEKVAKNAQDTLINLILNWKKESFYAPYREIIRKFYRFTDEQMTAIIAERDYFC